MSKISIFNIYQEDSKTHQNYLITAQTQIRENFEKKKEDNRHIHVPFGYKLLT